MERLHTGAFTFFDFSHTEANLYWKTKFRLDKKAIGQLKVTKQTALHYSDKNLYLPFLCGLSGVIYCVCSLFPTKSAFILCEAFDKSLTVKFIVIDVNNCLKQILVE